MSPHRLTLLILASALTSQAQQGTPNPPPPSVPVPAPGTVPEPTPAPPRPSPVVPNLPKPPTATTPPPGVPIPGGPPVRPAAAPIPAKPETPLSETLITEPIEELKLSGDSLASLYRRYTGRRVIVPTTAAQAEFRFVQDASPKDPLTYAEAAELLKKAAILESFVFVPHPNDPTIDVLTLSTSGIRPPGIGIAIFNEGDPIPEGDQVISYVMKLSYIKPADAVSIFTSVIGQFGSFGSVTPVPNASAIVITENTGLIRKLIDLKAEIDKAGSVQTSRFIPVQYADVTEIATVLTELLTAQAQAQKTAGVLRTDGSPQPATPPGVPSPAGGNAASGAVGGGEESPPQIIPDPRTNRIFALGRPTDLEFIEGLVQKFDIPTSDKTRIRIKIRYLSVSEFLPVAEKAINRAFAGTTDGAGSTAGGANSQQPRQPSTNRSQTSTSSSRNSRSTGLNNNSNSSMGGSGGGTSSSGGLDDPTENTAPESLLVGRTLLVADNITNSIIVQGPPSALEIVQDLLKELDVKAEQVMISCVFGQLGLTDDKDVGFNYLVRGNDILAGGGGTTFPALANTSTTDTGNDASFPLFDSSSLAGNGLRIYGTAGDFSMYFKALQSKSNFKVLSSPTISAKNNQRGSLSSGTSIAVPTGSYSYGTSSSMSTNYDYKEVALKLDVIPLVNSSNEVTLKIFLTSDDVGNDRTVGTGDSAYTIPDILKRELTTTITVPNKQTVVLGGLITETDKDTRTGIPILCEIPGIGSLFGSKSKKKDRSELVIFIQPTIISDNTALNDMQGTMDRRYKAAGDARNFVDGPGLPDNDIPPAVDSQGKGGSNLAAPATDSPQSTTPRKSSLRPIHRR